MEAVHKEMSEDYSNGVVTGYSKLEGSLREKLNKAQSLATDSLALEARSRWGGGRNDWLGQRPPMLFTLIRFVCAAFLWGISEPPATNRVMSYCILEC
eukprot:s934_g19.t1